MIAPAGERATPSAIAIPDGVPAPPEFVHAARRALIDPPQGVEPWFHRYHGDLLDDRGLRKWTRAKRQLLDLVGGVEGRVVLDAGSGFGMVSNLLASWRARRVLSLELREAMATTHVLVNARYFPELAGRVSVIRGDAMRIPLRSGSVDLVLSIEAISHYFDVESFLDECARVLRPGGRLVISDGNNGANPAIRSSTEELWQRMEEGPEGKVGEHEVHEPMVWRRERLLRGDFPHLPEPRVAELARLTSGMDRAEMRAAVASHLAGGPAPASRYRRGQCPREPEWGYVVERLFDARELAQRLARRGFSTRAIPHFGGAANDLVHVANLVLRSLPTHRWARAFRLVGTKR